MRNGDIVARQGCELGLLATEDEDSTLLRLVVNC